MRQSSSYQTDTASAFPESPKEGDFSSRQLYDNLKSLEEHGTCDDQKDPIVNIIPDNYSSCLLNTQISAPLSTNDLEKLCAGALPQEEANKKRELVELQMTKFSLNIERELLQNKADFVRPICCEQAKQTKELSLKEREKLAQIESDKNNNVIPRASIMSEEEQEIAKARSRERLNLTLVGGLCFSETGDLRRRWNWLYFDPHAHKLPSKPLTFALCPHISVRIHSQEHMCKTFTHQKNTVRFSVGSELKSVPKNMKSELEISPDNEVLSSLSKETPQTPTSCQGETEQSLTNLDKLNQAKGLMLPGPDMFQTYLQQKSAEINVLLQNIQSLITYQKTVSPQKVKP
ncbi:hypothetical protein EXN66_Car010478 [Channa argus]|uniref:FAM194 C-terminal domain-containing protein n=1 Tax=Channa argus TaxID=215402 RepID=A0A6G1PX20_CHAAH|nr:hypothetical protein EXN66_Car010478 [Channa argus]